jgi:hypothetical protein
MIRMEDSRGKSDLLETVDDVINSKNAKMLCVSLLATGAIGNATSPPLCVAVASIRKGTVYEYGKEILHVLLHRLMELERGNTR